MPKHPPMATFAPVLLSGLLTLALVFALWRAEAAWKHPRRVMRRRNRADERRYGRHPRRAFQHGGDGGRAPADAATARAEG